MVIRSKTVLHLSGCPYHCVCQCISPDTQMFVLPLFFIWWLWVLLKANLSFSPHCNQHPHMKFEENQNIYRPQTCAVVLLSKWSYMMCCLLNVCKLFMWICFALQSLWFLIKVKIQRLVSLRKHSALSKLQKILLFFQKDWFDLIVFSSVLALTIFPCLYQCSTVDY